MRFEEAYYGWTERRLTQREAARLLGVHERSFRRYINRYLERGLDGLLDRRLTQISHMLMLDAGELPGWVQRMMGHETMKMILERYYSYIKNYQRDDGSAFMENVYGSSTAPAIDAKWAPDLSVGK